VGERGIGLMLKEGEGSGGKKWWEEVVGGEERSSCLIAS